MTEQLLNDMCIGAYRSTMTDLEGRARIILALIMHCKKQFMIEITAMEIRARAMLDPDYDVLRTAARAKRCAICGSLE